MRAALYASWKVLAVAVVALQALALPVQGQLVDSRTAGGVASAPRTPLTAEFRITRVQVLSTGTTITRVSQEVIARDAQGRNMRATTVLSSAGDPSNTNVNVFDPASGEQITWNTLSKHAHVLKTPVGDQQHGCWSTSSGNATSRFGELPPPGSRSAVPADTATGSVLRSRTQPTRDDLGADTILGVEVHGVRTTRTIPAGQIGNDQPLVRTSESWTAPSLGLILRQITDDPQAGKTTREVVSIDLSDPSPAIFQPPAGYDVVTEEMLPVACTPTP